MIPRRTVLERRGCSVGRYRLPRQMRGGLAIYSAVHPDRGISGFIVMRSKKNAL